MAGEGPWAMKVQDLCDRAGRRVAIGTREREVLDRLLRGDTETEIAERLGISPHTVHTHVRSLYLKLDVHSRVELFRSLISTSG
jgi:DNA-binding CsgD family transcriptional regulator